MLLKPFRVVSHVTEIDVDELWTHGIRGFIFDLDNTLMAPRAGVLDEQVAGWLSHIEEKGFRSIVVSNNPLAFYIQEVEKIMNMPVIGNAGKPRRRFLFKALEHLALDAHEVVVVGDRPLTDIWGGHRLGSKTILVDPLTKHREHLLVKFLRRVERLSIHPRYLSSPKSQG